MPDRSLVTPRAPPRDPRPFRYCRDPVFLGAVALYALNRFVLKPLTSAHPGFFHWYVNDLLCLPFWLPPVLWLYRRIGLRRHDGPPTFGELMLHLIIWSFVFEVYAPGLERFRGVTTADPLDIVCYALGALAAAAVWHRPARPPAGEVVLESRGQEGETGEDAGEESHALPRGSGSGTSPPKGLERTG